MNHDRDFPVRPLTLSLWLGVREHLLLGRGRLLVVLLSLVVVSYSELCQSGVIPKAVPVR